MSRGGNVYRMREPIPARQSWGDRSIALTRWQRAGRAFFWAAAGSSLTMILFLSGHVLSPVAPVEMLQPSIEHQAEHYTVYRLHLRWQGAVKGCELIVFHDRQTWRLTCDPR